MTHVTCRLTAKNRDQLRNPTLGNRVWSIFTFFFLCYDCSSQGGLKIKVICQRQDQGVKVEVRVSKDGIGVGSTSILDRKQLVGGVA